MSLAAERAFFDGDHCKFVLSRGKVAMADREDFDLLSGYVWHFKLSGRSTYAASRRNGRCVFMHRLLLPTSAGLFVDHINGDGLDNRRRNLRVCTKQQNAWNTRASAGRSQFKGVFKVSWRDAWASQIRSAAGRKHLGTFDSEVEAARAYDRAARELHGEFACLNFPDLQGEAA